MSLKQQAKEVLELIERGGFCVDGRELQIEKYIIKDSIDGFRF